MRLEKTDMYVDKAKLQDLQKSAKDMETYARKLMWRILVPDSDVIAISTRKMEGVGFIKLFGKKNFDEFLGKFLNFPTIKIPMLYMHNTNLFLSAHVRKFTHDQKPKGGRWNNEQDTEASLKAKLGAAFDSKIKTIRETAKK